MGKPKGQQADKGSGKKSRAGSGRYYPQNIWGFLERVILASMSKGQLPVMLFGLIPLVAVWRMNPDDLGKTCDKVVDLLKSGSLVGWALVPILIFAWFTHVRIQRRILNSEVMRLADERNALQKQLLPHGAVASSNKKE